MNEIKKQSNNKEYYEDVEIDLFEYWLIVLKRWKIILALFVVTVTAASIISLNITPIYRATTSILPVSSSTTILSIVTTSGLPIAGSSEANNKKILAILYSRTIRENVIHSLNIRDVLLREWPESRGSLNMATAILVSILKVSSSTKTGLIFISIEHSDPELAKNIVNQYVKELELILREKSFTVIKMYRVFIEEQLKNEEKSLKMYREEMANFQKESKMIEPEAQFKGTMDLYSNLVLQKIDLEIELKKIGAALSEENPQIIAKKNQLKAIKEQINKIEEKKPEGAFTSFIDAPDQLIEYNELRRKIDSSQSIYNTFAQMYEKARFEEIKESIYVEVIDPAITPIAPFKPGKRKIVGLSGIASILFGIFLVIFIEWYRINIMRRKKKT